MTFSWDHLVRSQPAATEEGSFGKKGYSALSSGTCSHEEVNGYELESWLTQTTLESDRDTRHLLRHDALPTFKFSGGRSVSRSIVNGSQRPRAKGFKNTRSRLIPTLRAGSSRFQGWRMGVLLGCCMSATILCFNIGFFIFASMRGYGFQDGFAEPFNVEPRKMSQLSSAIHIVINILSTILLSASNYTMQVLSSPTRLEVHRAHRAGRWFDIGVLSVHNLRHISAGRTLLCAILVLSSVPLHLFYNSAAIYIAATHDFQVNILLANSTEASSLATRSGLLDMTNGAWKRAYDSNVVSFGDLSLVIDMWSSDPPGKNSVPEKRIDTPSNISWPYVFPDVKKLGISGLDNWVNASSVQGYNKLYGRVYRAYGTEVPFRSRLQISKTFLIVVIVCNFIKLITMVVVLFGIKSEFLVTLGDGVASFLEYRDPATERYCVFNKDAITAELSHRIARDGDFEPSVPSSTAPEEPPAQDMLDEAVSRAKADLNLSKKVVPFEHLVLNSSGVWHNVRSPYSSAIVKERDVGSTFIAFVTILTFFLCLAMAYQLGSENISRLWGTASPEIALGGDNSEPGKMLEYAWLANLPQIILSFCYFAINSQYTSIAGAYEWNNMAVLRKGLRVIRPFREQRSTYFLQLPMRFSLPLVLFSGGLHWLLSQSIFLVRIDSVTREETVREHTRLGCGASGLSIVVLCLTFWVLVVGTGIAGRMHMNVKIPLAASCSLVISAACHAPSEEEDTHLKRVQWGVVRQRMYDGELHCSFSSDQVTPPVPDTVYR